MYFSFLLFIFCIWKSLTWFQKEHRRLLTLRWRFLNKHPHFTIISLERRYYISQELDKVSPSPRQSIWTMLPIISSQLYRLQRQVMTILWTAQGALPSFPPEICNFLSGNSTFHLVRCCSLLVYGKYWGQMLPEFYNMLLHSGGLFQRISQHFSPWHSAPHVRNAL